MKANKITATIKIEALSIDTLPGLLSHMAEQLMNEVTEGSLLMSDGDLINWKVKSKAIKF